MRTLESASPEVVTSLRNWYQGEQHTDEEEYEYLEHLDDLVALAGRERSKDWLQKFLEKNFAAWYPLRMQKVRATRTARNIWTYHLCEPNCSPYHVRFISPTKSLPILRTQPLSYLESH
jgi:hypothetical protein